MENANLQSEEVVLTAQKIYRRNLLWHYDIKNN
jgi:hypothetical protein